MPSYPVIEIQATDSIEAAAARVTLQRDVVIILLGSFDATIAPQVRSICARVVGPVAQIANAVIVDDGRSDGLTAQMGQAALLMDQPPTLLGILDSGVTDFDPNHTQVVRLPSAWSDSAKSRLLLIAELAKISASDQRPVVAVLFGGSDADKITLQRCARRGWPILVVAGAGGLGDEILAALVPPVDGAPQAAVPDADLQEILDTGILCPLPLSGGVDDLTRVLLGPLQQPGEVLADAWGRYDELDQAAIDKQIRFKSLEFAILSLAVVATLLAVAISGSVLPAWMSAWFYERMPWLGRLNARLIAHWLLILVPITTSILVSFNSRFREGNKWILLRAAAESIKREIYRNRTRTGAYSEPQCIQTSAQSKLAASVQTITANLSQSEVNRSSLPSRVGDNSTRIGFMRPEDYLLERVEDQTKFFVRKTGVLYRRLWRLQLLVLIAGGLGTFLAAIHFEVWVALTTALATAFTTKLEMDQVENSLVQYNVALTSLKNIQSWWKGLSSWEKSRRKNIDLLVDQTEKALERETAGWVQQMQSELDKLTEKQPASAQRAAQQ